MSPSVLPAASRKTLVFLLLCWNSYPVSDMSHFNVHSLERKPQQWKEKSVVAPQNPELATKRRSSLVS